jgi:hypothetical protein
MMSFEVPTQDFSNLSILLLGSSRARQMLITDVCDLIDRAEEEEVYPVAIRLGSLFLDICICSSLRLENDISGNDWPEYVEKHRSQLAVAYTAYKLKILESNSKSDGLRSGRFFEQIPDNLEVFYDPDEPYISILVCDPSKKAKKGEPSSKDGYLIATIRLKDQEVFYEYSTLRDHI